MTHPPKPKRKYHYRTMPCDIPWCNRNEQTNLFPKPFFGAVLMLCKSHDEIYDANSEVLWRKLAEGYDPMLRLKAK